MFQLWLQKQPTASWNQLIDSLRQPGVDLGHVADKIEQMLPKPTGVHVIVYVSIMNCLTSCVCADHKASSIDTFQKCVFVWWL